MDDWLELCRKALDSDDVLSVAPRDEFAKMLNAYDALRAQLHADDQRAWEALGKPEGTHETTNVQRLCAEVASLREGQEELARAVKFLDMCNKERIASGDTGAMSDAWQWVEEAAREMIDAAKETP